MIAQDAPAQDWKTIRLGANPPAGMVSLSSNAAVAILAACGTPAALMVAGSAGTAAREALRRWLHTTLIPLGPSGSGRAESGPERSRAFDFKLRWPIRNRIFRAGRGRLARLVKSGMDLDRAAALAGLLTDDDREDNCTEGRDKRRTATSACARSGPSGLAANPLRRHDSKFISLCNLSSKIRCFKFDRQTLVATGRRTA